jgi:hypothetical protein
VDRNQIRWNDRDRGVIETNTLSPERDRGAVGNRDAGRVSEVPGLQRGRNVLRGGSTARDTVPEREVRQSSGEPPSIVDSERRNGRLERDNGRSDAEAPPRVIGRQNIGRPSASSEKQERSRVESPAVGGREPVYREPSAPSLERRVPRTESRIERPQEEVRAPTRRIETPPAYREERGRSIESQSSPAPVQSAPAREPTRQLERGGGNDGGERRGRQNDQGEAGDRKGRR